MPKKPSSKSPSTPARRGRPPGSKNKGTSSKSKPKTGIVLPAVPEEDPLTSPVVIEAVQYINDHLNHTAESALEIGRYLLSKFFSDDPRKVQDRSPHKGISLHDLASHPEIGMSFSSLQRATRLAAGERVYFTDPTSGQLSPSVKLLLLRLEDEHAELIKKYSSRAILENLSFRKLQEILRENGHLSQRGLAALPEDQRHLISYGLSRITSPLDDFLLATLDKFEGKFPGELELMTKSAVQSTIDKVKLARSRMDEIIERLEKRL